ncbi:MAG TPA: DsbA family protein [Nevskia sp.]|nr:DsbA family protein [Nevskia sp.]
MSAPDTVDFYFDFASPYAYFAHGAIGALAQRHGLRLRRRPVLLWAILKELGMPPPAEQPAKSRYMRHDMNRSAAYYGLPFRLPPRFPQSSHAAARLYYTLEARAPERCGEFTDAVFRAYFVDNLDLGDAAVLAPLAAPLSADEARQALEAEAAKAALRQANAEAAQRGVWGSPYWFWGEEAFFGADRLPQFERLLAAGR